MGRPNLSGALAADLAAGSAAATNSPPTQPILRKARADRFAAGGRQIRTIGPARERDGRGEGDPRPTIVVSRDPCLNDPLRLIGPASPFGNSRDPVVRAGPVVRIQLSPAESLTRT